MRADPKPQQPAWHIDADHPIMQTDSGGPETANLLEL
jgi:hypothetical protein